MVKDGGFGKFMHRREPTPIAKQTVIRMNRDTLYSAAVFDLDAGPVTITLPDAGKRFLSMQVIDEDEYSPEVVYGAAVRTLTKEEIGTRYVIVAVRILVDPERSEGCRGGPCAAGCDQDQPARRTRNLQGPQLGRIEPGQSAGRLARASLRPSPTPRACSAQRARSTPSGI